MIYEFRDPVAVTTPLGDGWLFYVQPGGWKENDILTVILRDGGDIRHFRTDQVRVWMNATWEINKSDKPWPQ
jgi:hypothetical protein